jgi:uncharacterized membrane protein
MSSESVCQFARSWVDVGSFYTRLVVRFMILQRQYGIFWIHPRICCLISVNCWVLINSCNKSVSVPITATTCICTQCFCATYPALEHKVCPGLVGVDVTYLKILPKHVLR